MRSALDRRPAQWFEAAVHRGEHPPQLQQIVCSAAATRDGLPRAHSKSIAVTAQQDSRPKMQPVVDIRTMADADLPAVLAIQAICYTQVTPESKESLHAKLSASQSTCLIASLAGDTVGYLIALPWEISNPPALNARTCELPSAPSCLYLHDLAVTPDARKSGAGRALVEAFLTRLKRTGLRRASLVAVQDSAPYWERHGFRPVALSEPLRAKLSTYGKGVQYMERTT